MKLLIIGFGSIGQRHYRNLLKLGYKNVFVYDTDKTKTKNKKIKTIPNLNNRTLKTFGAALICNPNNKHIETAIKCAQAGCHLFIEKPLSHNLYHLDKLNKICVQNKLITLVGCNMRFHPCLKFIKRYLQNQQLGKIYAISHEFGYYLPYWRTNQDYRKNYAAKKSTGGGIITGCMAGVIAAQTISDCLTRVEIFDGQKIKWLKKNQCQFVYRDSIFKSKDWLILRTQFRLAKGDRKALAKKAHEIIKIRSEKYDPSLRCPGSFFKNVLIKDISSRAKKLIDQSKVRDGKIPTGYLLEAVGAKGMRHGGIYIADFHGNLLINDGHGTYRDVIILTTKLKKLVKNKFGITLEEEVQYML